MKKLDKLMPLQKLTNSDLTSEELDSETSSDEEEEKKMSNPLQSNNSEYTISRQTS